MPFRLLIVLCLLVAVSGCGSTRIYYVSSQKYDRRQAEDVRLYATDIQRPYKEVAWVQSYSDRGLDAETKRRQMAAMRKRAARLGADAIIEIEQMSNNVRGAVVDEAVPFRAFRQGEYELYFLRGMAVRFVREDGFDPLPERETARPIEDADVIDGEGVVEETNSEEPASVDSDAQATETTE